MTRRTILDVNKTGPDQYAIQLLRGEDQWFSAGSRQFKVKVNLKAVTELQHMFGEAVDSASQNPDTPGIALDPFITLGRGLFSALLPSRQVDELRKELNSDDSPLLIQTDDPDPLWEYMNSGGEPGFLCLKRDVGRVLKTTDFTEPPPPRPDRKWRCLMIADPTEDLPDAREEARQLRRWLEKERDIDCSTYLEGEAATYGNVLARLGGDEFDIIHYAGHVKPDPSTQEYGMVLHGDVFFTPETIKDFVKGGMVVFLNGCRSARVVKGLAEAFIAVGVRVVIGSLFDTPDKGGRVFAETFYSGALSGKAVGDALRLARKSVMGNSDFAAAWACFLMYGDPTLRLDLRTDDLRAVLKQLELTRQDFEPSAARVVEKAVQFGAPLGNVSTAHLFAAMVGGENPHLRDQLRAAGVRPERLQTSFEEVFRHAEGDGAGGREGDLEFSSNTGEILRLALRAAQEGGRAKIGELDLAAGFVGQGGGAAGEILRHLGVKLASLAPGPRGTPEERAAAVGRGGSSGSGVVRRVGDLGVEDCTPEAWRVLAAAADIAAGSGPGQVSTPHLFWGLNQDPAGALARALQRLQLTLSFGGHLPPRVAEVAEEVSCSKNAADILLDAKAAAAATERLVTDEDLLAAFARSEGGSRFSEKHGLVLDALASKLFLQDGSLDLGRFDSAARVVIDGAIDCATKKRYPVWGRRHLLYGMLVAEGGLLLRRIADQGVDAELLADQIYAAMEMGSTRSDALQPSYRITSSNLVRVLCQAEHMADDDSAPQITDVHLLRAWLADGGGEIGVFLARNGVRLRRLL